MGTGLLIARHSRGLATGVHAVQKLLGWLGGEGLKGTGGSLGFWPGVLFGSFLFNWYLSSLLISYGPGDPRRAADIAVALVIAGGGPDRAGKAGLEIQHEAEAGGDEIRRRHGGHTPPQAARRRERHGAARLQPGKFAGPRAVFHVDVSAGPALAPART